MLRILIVEDEAHILRIMSLWLARNGYEILEAENGAVALEILDREHVDIIISDMNMPRMDGLELVRLVREQRKLDAPFLLMTARCDQDALREKLRPYRVQLYPKPFVPSRLVAEIDALAGRAIVQGSTP